MLFSEPSSTTVPSLEMFDAQVVATKPHSKCKGSKYCCPLYSCQSPQIPHIVVFTTSKTTVLTVKSIFPNYSITGAKAISIRWKLPRYWQRETCVSHKIRNKGKVRYNRRMFLQDLVCFVSLNWPDSLEARQNDKKRHCFLERLVEVCLLNSPN